MSQYPSQEPGIAPLAGVLVIDKPQGITSHDVVNRVRRILGKKRIGHVGTLDPMATGVLPLVIEKATRLASFLSTGDKVYYAVIQLGRRTDTYDTTGTLVERTMRTPTTSIDISTIEAAAKQFTGTFLQAPPPYSAKKIGGVRAYKLARRHTPVTPQPVEVTVRELKIEALEGTRITCRVTCEPGFYMRSLAHDLGEALGVGGCLDQLRRERSGAFSLADSISLHNLELKTESAPFSIVPLNALLPDLPSVVVTTRGAQLTAHGNTLMKSDLKDEPESSFTRLSEKPTHLKVFDREGTLLAIAEEQTPGVLQPRIVLV